MKKIALFLTAVSVTAASPAYATNGMRMIGFGPTQVGMGGVVSGHIQRMKNVPCRSPAVLTQSRPGTFGVGVSSTFGSGKTGP